MAKNIFCALLGVLFAASSYAGGTSIAGDKRTYYIALFDPASVCVTEEIGDTGVVEGSCSGNGFFVSANSESGCGDSVGPTYCASISRKSAVVGASELSCDNGEAYILSAGLDEVRCKHRDGYSECVSFDGASSAKATCEKGCGFTRGAGGCCRAGTDGCPPGLPTSVEK